jgi:tRNA threonylcarbamoyladenosine biosynthesis protein TsaE
MIRTKTFSWHETVNLGKRFAKILKERDVVVLEGVLGGGKTTFVKGILKGLNFKENAISPSFTLVRQYNKRNLHIYHVDLYRLGGDDVFSIGIEDYLYAPGSITLIEWGEKIEGYLPSYIKVRFDFSRENIRKVSFSLKGLRDRKLNIFN